MLAQRPSETTSNRGPNEKLVALAGARSVFVEVLVASGNRQQLRL